MRPKPLIDLEKVNDYQVILTTDGLNTFVFFIYDNLMWPNGDNIPVMGFINGDLKLSNKNITITKLLTTGNINGTLSGKWLYRIDGNNSIEF